MVVSCKSSRSVSSGVPQESTLGLILFSILLSDLNNETECTINKFAEDTKPRRVADTPEGHADIQRDLNRLEKWPDGNLMKVNNFSNEKCKVMHLMLSKVPFASRHLDIKVLTQMFEV